MAASGGFEIVMRFVFFVILLLSNIVGYADNSFYAKAASGGVSITQNQLGVFEVSKNSNIMDYTCIAEGTSDDGKNPTSKNYNVDIIEVGKLQYKINLHEYIKVSTNHNFIFKNLGANKVNIVCSATNDMNFPSSFSERFSYGAFYNLLPGELRKIRVDWPTDYTYRNFNCYHFDFHDNNSLEQSFYYDVHDGSKFYTGTYTLKQNKMLYSYGTMKYFSDISLINLGYQNVLVYCYSTH